LAGRRTARRWRSSLHRRELHQSSSIAKVNMKAFMDGVLAIWAATMPLTTCDHFR